MIDCLIRKAFGGYAINKKNVDHMNWTLNVFEVHQYLISLLRKTQNTLSEPAVKKNWVMGICSQKGNYQLNDRELFLDHVSY